MDVDDLDSRPREKASSVFVEEVGIHAGELELVPVLEAESLVRCQENDAVQFTLPAVECEIVPILEDVHVHEKRLARTSRAPKGELSEVVGCIWFDPNILR